MASAASSAERELDRIGAFSDGVFAIAITLLVLNIEVPSVPGSQLGRALSDLTGDIVTFGIGFAVIGIFWIEHHRLFSRLGRSNARLLFANLVLLALIALMPFTTGVLGRYDEPVAVALYAGNVGVALLADGVTEWVAEHDGLLAEVRPRAAPPLVAAALRAAVFFASIPLAYAFSQSAAKWFWLALLVVAAVLRRLDARAGARGASSPSPRGPA
jgi:uncharacterized membrane protein